MEIKISLDGNKKVSARFDDYRVETDQPREDGGEGSAPSPFDLFLVSIGTCAGFFVQRFCQARGIDPRGIEIRQRTERDAKSHLVSTIRIEISVPAEFPEKYKPGLLAAVNSCTVKKHLQNPPQIETVVGWALEARPDAPSP